MHTERQIHTYICTYIQREIHTHAHIHTERKTHLHIYINTHATNTLIKINAMGPKQKKNMKVKVRPVGKKHFNGRRKSIRDNNRGKYDQSMFYVYEITKEKMKDYV